MSGKIFMNVNEMLTVKEVAKILKASERTVYRRIESGKLIACEFDGMLRILPNDLERYIQESRHNKLMIGEQFCSASDEFAALVA